MVDQNTQDLLAPSQAANILGVSIETLNVWRSTKRYHLPYVKVGRLVKYRECDITQFIESNLVGAEPN